MFKTQLKEGNIIYHSIPYEQIRKRIHFGNVSNCTVFIAPNARLQECDSPLEGDHAAAFIGNAQMGKAELHISEQSCVYIGDKTYLNGGTNAQFIPCCGRSNIIIGNSCAISTAVEITNTDVHLIYNKSSRSRINEEGSIFIGDHVWLGREAKVFRRACISSGCIAAARSLVTGKVFPANSIISGIPGRTNKQGEIFWLSPASLLFTDADIKHYSRLEAKDKMYINACYEANKGQCLSPADLDVTLKSLTNSHDKIAFLYDKIYLNKSHNRFCWDNCTWPAEGSIITYDDAFSRLKNKPEEAKSASTDSIATPHLSPADITAILYAGEIKRKWLYYGFMSIITFGWRRSFYRDKKRRMRQLKKRLIELKKDAWDMLNERYIHPAENKRIPPPTMVRKASRLAPLCLPTYTASGVKIPIAGL